LAVVVQTHHVRRRAELFMTLAASFADPEVLRDLTGRDLDEVLVLADHHRVLSQLAGPFAAASLPVPAAVTADRQAATLLHLRTADAVRRAGRALDAAGIRWAALKGPVLADRVYGDPAARRYQDLDLLVDPAAFADAIDALAAVGYGERTRNWAGLRRLGLGEVPLVDDTLMIDLHWHVVALERDRRAFAFRTADLLDRRVPIEIGGVGAWALADADLAAHTVLHALLNGAHLLLHLRDVHLAAALDWPAALERCRQARLGPGAAAVVDRAERVLGPIPHAASPDVLGGRAWRRLNAVVDGTWTRLAPGATNPFPSAVVMSGRATAGATAVELGRHGVDAVRRRLGRPTITSPGGPLDFDVDAGGSRERDRYLRDVATGTFG
jgi:hypothetical protein